MPKVVSIGMPTPRLVFSLSNNASGSCTSWVSFIPELGSLGSFWSMRNTRRALAPINALSRVKSE
ncbi:hypothetical protein D3C84_1138410 [compost metagenome]